MTEQPGAPTPSLPPATSGVAAPPAVPWSPSPAREPLAATHPVPSAIEATPPPRRRGWRRLWVTLAILAAIGLIGLSAYLVVVSAQWSDRVDELTTISEDLGATVANARTAQADAEARLATAQTALDNATARITDLANEEANATDNESVLIAYVDAMIDCADGRQELIDVLTNSRLYYPGSSTVQVEQDLVTYCDGVKNDLATFKLTDTSQ